MPSVRATLPPKTTDGAAFATLRSMAARESLVREMEFRQVRDMLQKCTRTEGCVGSHRTLRRSGRPVKSVPGRKTLREGADAMLSVNAPILCAELQERMLEMAKTHRVRRLTRCAR